MGIFELILFLSCVKILTHGLTELDPHTENEFNSNTIRANIFESLVSFDAQMNIVPRLAAHWEKIDDTTWIFYLRRGVKFHNGKEFTAYDVVYSIDRIKKLIDSRMKDYIIGIKSYIPLGKYKLKMVSYRSTLLNNLPFVFIISTIFVDA